MGSIEQGYMVDQAPGVSWAEQATEGDFALEGVWLTHAYELPSQVPPSPNELLLSCILGFWIPFLSRKNGVEEGAPR
jgi:hypothetical protein